MKHKRTIIAFSLVSACAVAAVATAMAASGGTSSPPPARPPTAASVSSPQRGRLGLAVLEISPALRVHLGASDDRGLLVDGVAATSPARSADVRVGDVLVGVAGTPVRSVREVRDALSDHRKGDKIELSVIRDGKPLELRAVLDDAPPVDALGSAPRSDDWPELFDSDELFDSAHGDPQAEQMLRHVREQFERMRQHLEATPHGADGHT